MEKGPCQGSTHHWGLRACILEAAAFPMEAVVGPRGLGNLLHDALRLHILLSPSIDGHMGALEQKQHFKQKLCELWRGQAELLSVHLAKATTAPKTSVRGHQGSALPVDATQLLLRFNRCSGTFHLVNEHSLVVFDSTANVLGSSPRNPQVLGSM